MSLIVVARNGSYVPGQALLDRVSIPGWEKRSVWGWDAHTGSLYARLWQNIDHDDAPRYWVDGHAQCLCHPGHLALVLLEVTPLPPLALIEGLGLSGDWVLADRASTSYLLEQSDRSSPRGQGMVRGLQWVLGQCTRCPGTHLPWLPGVSPTAQVVHAERVYAVGRLAQAVARPGRRYVADQCEIQSLEGVVAVLDAVLVDPPT